MRSRFSPPLLIAIALPLLLAVALAVIGIAARAGAFDPAPEAGPLAVVPVDAPAATGPDCAGLLAALPAELPGADGALPPRPLVEPAPAGVRAWAAAPRPVVLRCGLPRPAELGPTSALLVVDGVNWLRLDDGTPDPVVITYVAVDRPAFVAVTTPPSVGGAPLQRVSEAVRATLPAVPVPVR